MLSHALRESRHTRVVRKSASNIHRLQFSFAPFPLGDAIATLQNLRCFATENSGRKEIGVANDDGGEGGDGDLIVSILGPPNAGKSTLFNRLMCRETNKTYRLASEKRNHRRKQTGSRARLGYPNPSKRAGGAIVSTTAGTTRDRRECVGRIGGTTFKLIDTAGVDGEKLAHLVGREGSSKHPPLARSMIGQTLTAARESDLILLMFDAKEAGVTADLAETAKWLRKLSFGSIEFPYDGNEDEGDESDGEDDGADVRKNVTILANKLEGDGWTTDAESPVLDHLAEASRVGFGEAIPISAEHGEGLADVAVIIEKLTEQKRRRNGLSEPMDDFPHKKKNASQDDVAKPLQLAILGRQNVGKSTLVNALLKQDRVITSSTPGSTRDSIAVEWSWNGRPVKLVDTAGIRKAIRRNQSDNDGIEEMAVQDAMRAMRIADVAVLVLDAEARVLQRQELAIANAVVKEGRSLVVAANKMDLLVDADYSQEDYSEAVSDQIELRLPMLRRTPVVAMSSLTGESVDKLMPVAFDARDRWSRTIPTGLLNRWLADVVGDHPPPKCGGRQAKIKYVMQTKGRPPTFLLFCNTDELPGSYLRYLTRNFQDTFKMFGMEVRLALKKSSTSNPYARGGNKRAGRGLGGHEARKQRTLSQLRKTGAVVKKGVRRRKMRKR